MKTYQLELKRERKKPLEMVPEQPNAKLKRVIKQAATVSPSPTHANSTLNTRATQKTLLGASTRRNRDIVKTSPGLDLTLAST